MFKQTACLKLSTSNVRIDECKTLLSASADRRNSYVYWSLWRCEFLHAGIGVRLILPFVVRETNAQLRRMSMRFIAGLSRKKQIACYRTGDQMNRIWRVGRVRTRLCQRG